MYFQLPKVRISEQNTKEFEYFRTRVPLRKSNGIGISDVISTKNVFFLYLCARLTPILQQIYHGRKIEVVSDNNIRTLLGTMFANKHHAQMYQILYT